MLFTDVVASTELLGRLGSKAEDLRTRHFSEMRGALAVHRGTEVKTLGDGFMAAFGSAGDALACAVTMQGAVAKHNSRCPEQELRIRIGLSAGEATYDEGDYFGAPVVEASRLCASAAPGQILVSEVVRMLVGSAGIHQLEPIGQLELKGLAAPVMTFNVNWVAEEESALRVALVDDAVLLREGIAQLLESEGVDVVLQAGEPESLLAALPAVLPHVVVIDIRMPPTHTTEGLDAAQRIRSEHPEIGVLVLSQSLEPVAAQRLLYGATDGVGYLLKERVADAGELAAAIRTIAGGGSAIDPDVVGLLSTSTT